jgi:hypothetical protein
MACCCGTRPQGRVKIESPEEFGMLKKMGAPSFLIAALCGYLALFTPDWKSELHAQAGEYYLDGNYKGSSISESQSVQ